jgi:hypothetical protein
MSGGGSQIDGGRELVDLRQREPLWGNLIGRLIDGVNRLAGNLSASPLGELPAPSPVNSTSVAGTLTNNVLTAPGEILHFVHTHNVPLNRGIQYLTEISANDPSFSAPHQIDTGSSRSGFVSLPTKDSSNNLVNYYLRVTAQYHGSAPSKPVVFGGLQGPTIINMGGTTQMTLLPSQAAGTATPGQGGKGLGPVVYRGPVGGPKRVL